MKISSKNKGIIFGIILIVFFVITFIRVQNSVKKDDIKEINTEIIFSFSKSYFDTIKTESRKVLLFVDFADFSCLPCSEGVSYICKTLDKELNENEKRNVLILIRKRSGTDEYYSWVIKNWREENKITFPIKLDNDNIFEKVRIQKTSIIILDENQNIFEHKEFPMSSTELNRILSLIMG